MEADRKAMQGDTSMLPDPDFHAKTTYKIGSKVFPHYTTILNGSFLLVICFLTLCHSILNKEAVFRVCNWKLVDAFLFCLDYHCLDCCLDFVLNGEKVIYNGLKLP